MKESKNKGLLLISFLNMTFWIKIALLIIQRLQQEVEKTMKEKKFELLEDAITTIEKQLKKKYPIKNLKIKISKPDILKNCIVSLEN
ncbi:MAG: hypothetical protein ACNI3H_07780 [Halarcobacter ebronensis]